MKKTFKLLLTAMLLIAALAFCVSAAPSAVVVTEAAEENYVPVVDDGSAELLAISGSGTVADPFIVVTEEDLMLVSDFPDCHFKLANDIALTSTDWEPLCVLTDPFSGTFDGDGYTISNLKIATNRRSEENGLFSSNAGTIKNLNVKTSTTGITGHALRLGVLAGYNTGTIQNCMVDGIINTYWDESGSESRIGGLVGYNASSGVIEKCYSNVNIYFDMPSTEYFMQIYVGGLVGTNVGVIKKGFYDGLMDLGGATAYKPQYVIGGLVGYSGTSSSTGLSIITDSASITTISNSDGMGNCYAVAGLAVCANYSSVTNCYAVVSNNSTGYGLVYSYQSSSNVSVTNSFYDKTVSGLTDTGYGTPKSTAAMKMSQTYTNAGWDFDSTWAISEDINDGYPYLRWMYETTYKVTYDANGGEGAPDSQRKYEDVDLVLSDIVPTRDGYKFLGWAVSADATEAEYLPGATYSLNSDLDLCAVWEKLYAITYDYTDISTQYKEADVDVALSDVVPSMELRAFLGWATSPDSDVVEYAPGDVYSANADLNLYAVWKNLYVDINIGEKTSSANVRYYEVGGYQYALTETSDNLFRVVPEADMLVEIVEKESTASSTAVGTKYYYVDYETLTYSELTLDSFINNTGKPSIRVSEPKGIRFKSTFSTLAKKEESEFVIEEYGFVVALQSHLDAADAQLNFDFSKYVKGVAYNKYNGIDKIFDSSNDEALVFSGVLYNIPDTAYEIAVTSKTYTKISINGQSFTVYGEAASASMYEIAKSIVDSEDISEETRAELEKIIVKVEGEPVVDDELDNEIEIEGDDLFD